MTITNSSSLAALAIALLAGPALAQATNTAAAPKEEELIVVTGSNIKGASDSGALAVTILNADDIAAFGVNSTGEIF